MTTAYEELTDEDRLAQAMHLEQKVGPHLEEVLNSIQYQLDQLILQMADVMKDTFQIGDAWGENIDMLGDIYDIKRVQGETDEDLRGRITRFPQEYETVTIDAIVDLFENVTGRRPYLYEGFRTRVYRSGDPTEPGDAGRFVLLFEIPRDVAHERVKMQPSGTYVVVSHPAEQLVEPQIGAVSLTTSVGVSDTTIYAQSVTGFSPFGGMKIDTEWIRYASLNTTTIAFEGCDRGMWQTMPEVHSSNAPITEGTMLAWIEGTNNMVFDYREEQNVYLEGGPYDEWTWVDLEYKITDLDPDYDELSELIQSVAEFKSIGLDYKAGGVRADFEIGMVFYKWFEQSEENLIITDDVIFEAENYSGLFEINLPMPAFAGPFQVGYWDIGCWDHMLWGTPGTEESGGYNLRIEASIPWKAITRTCDARIA